MPVPSSFARRHLGHRRRLCSAAALVSLLLSLGCGGSSSDGDDHVRVRVQHVGLDLNDSPVVVLTELAGDRWLPIWIGTAEARSIDAHLGERAAVRPNSHDLAQRVIEGLASEVVRVVVTDLRSNTYYATLTLRRSGEEVDIDSRPSDAIAIALRTGAPIFVSEHLLADEESGSDADASESI